jgi:hypothetical protein
MIPKDRRGIRKTKTSIWEGIVQRAVADGDYSLLEFDYSFVKRRKVTMNWFRYAAAIVLVTLFSYSLYHFTRDNALSDKQLSNTYQDTTGRSLVRLANGKAVVLNGSSYSDSILGLNTRTTAGLDYRKLSSSNEKVEMHVFETSRGKQDHFTLADGTGVWVNAGSKVTFPTRFNDKKRVVELSGEAYFEVAHDKSKPFIVIVDQQQVEVLGTHFNVRTYQEEVDKEVVLLEGSVRVASRAQPAKAVVMAPAQRLKMHNNGDYHLDNIPNPEFYIAWKNGEFSFQDTEVGSVIKELERWYPVKIQVDEQDSRKRISGKMRKNWSMKEIKDAFQYFDIALEISMKK